MPKNAYLHLLAVFLLVACKPSAEAKPLPPTVPDAAQANRHAETAAPDKSMHRGPKGVTGDYFSCLDAASGTIDRAQCMSEEAARQDVRLNSIYKKLLESLDKDRKELLTRAQREWLTLREKDGAFEASLFDSTQAENLSSEEREIFYVSERADRLQEWLDMISQK